MLFKNKFRIESSRLKGWDYSNAGAYFITICTHRRIHHFGRCQNGRLQLSAIGLMVQGCWFEISRLNPQVELGAFIVMPNHVHGIIILPEKNNGFIPNHVETLQCNVSTTAHPNANNAETNKKSKYHQKITPKSGSVSTIIRSFKSACTKHINQTFPDAHFKWQERFHDHIIRNQPAYDRISNYIKRNPVAWMEDRFYEK